MNRTAQDLFDDYHNQLEQIILDEQQLDVYLENLKTLTGILPDPVNATDLDQMSGLVLEKESLEQKIAHSTQKLSELKDQILKWFKLINNKSILVSHGNLPDSKEFMYELREGVIHRKQVQP
jgi:hypothetical protein